MAKILNFFRTIRNNWKKSLVGVAGLSYGTSYSKTVYDTNQLMRQYCENVSQYGDLPLPTNVKPRHVTIILNPAGQKIVSILLRTTPAFSWNCFAGGDGTLSDVLTGLVRKYDCNLNSVKQCPIGILPLGQANKIAKSLYREYDDLSDVKQIIEATMAIINEESKMIDMIEIKSIEDNSEEPIKPIYAMGTVEWGAWKDADASASKYWYLGPLKKYATYVFNGFKNNLNQYCDAILKYTLPCEGCSRCNRNNSFLSGSSNLNTRWWHAFIPKTTTTINNIDYSKIINEKCDILHELPVSTSELHIETSNLDKSQVESSPPCLKVKMGPKDIDYFSFVHKGWRKEKSNQSLCDQVAEAKHIELSPQKVDKDCTLYIDNEEYELKNVEIKLLSRAVKVFCTQMNS
ncbi:unnamed protein product [Xylocopa violacea]|uniref:Acylglycerol kinase, mitochondrial n=1 Tax=Xylocopa violacea TaxID=135666 RepID=A0ABP1N1T4_XYLVO